jgi:L-glutamine-phosphate cytidylyltransferase
MRAVILAAGAGTRLSPLTDDRPKCLVPLLGVPILARLLRVLRQSGVDDITIIGGYRHEQLAAVAPDCRIIVNPQHAVTNMVGTLFCDPGLFARDDDDLLICYSDIICEPSVLAALMACDEPVAVAVNTRWRELWEKRMPDPLQDAETMKRDAAGFVRELGKKARSYDEIDGQYMGLIKLRASHLRAFADFHDRLDRKGLYDGKSRAMMYMTSFLQLLIDAGWRVKGVPVPGGWLEVDTMEDWDLYHRLAREGALDAICALER